MNKYFAIMLLFFCSCSQKNGNLENQSQDSQIIDENNILKRELTLKEKELQQSRDELASLNKKEAPISELYKQVKSGVFMVYTKGLVNVSQGTGFFINTFGIALSNFHVFENADEAIVVLDNGEKYLISKIIESNEKLDYVIFQVENRLTSNYSLQISDELPEIGSTCFAIGNPQGLTQTLSIGNISGYRNGDNLIQTTTEITHGSSGGPLFNKYGQVIGITSSGLGEANLNFALNINRVPYQSYLNTNENSSLEQNSIPISTIKTTIINYYSTLFNEDFDNLFNIYAQQLDRFFNAFNISQIQAVNEARAYRSKFKVISANNNIYWETLNVIPAANETYYITFNMDYFIQRIDNNKNKSFNLDIVMTLTKDMKIKSIYENIISKN